jgi:hypothetical protein
MDRARIVLSAIVAIALARYAAACLFIHPFGDDFSYAVAGMRTELVPRLLEEYKHWNGRWASNALVLRGPLVLGMEQGLLIYRLVPVILLGVAWFGWRSLARALMPGLSRADALLAPSLLLLIALHAMPDLGEGLFWYTGAITYFLPASLTLFLFAFWVQVFRDGWRLDRAQLVKAALLAVIIAGFNETHMVLMVLLHILLLGANWRDRRDWHRGIAVVLVAVLAAGAVMALAPGNAVRAAQFPLRGEMLRSIGWGALQTGRFLGSWLLSPVALFAAILVLSNGRWVLERAPWVVYRPLPGARLLSAVIILLVFAAMALPYWTTGLLGQHRTVNAAWLFILPCIVLLIGSLLVARQWSVLPVSWRTMAWALLFICIFFTGSGGRLSGDLLSGRFARLDQQLERRYAIMEEARSSGKRDLMLPALDELPVSAHYLDAGDDPGWWINRSIGLYFGADSMSISVQPPAR